MIRDGDQDWSDGGNAVFALRRGCLSCTKHQWVRRCSFIGNEQWASFQKEWSLPVDLVPFDGSTAEKTSAEKERERHLKRPFMSSSAVPLMYTKDLALDDEDLVRFALPWGKLVSVFLCWHMIPMNRC